MAYSAGGLIQASDFNSRVGGNPTTTADTLNAVWATGGSQAGYGQTAVANVTAGDPVTTTPWNQLFFNTGNAASHQGTSITSIANVSAGNTIAFQSALGTNLSSIYSSRGNAASQGATSANTQTTAGAWTDYANFAFTCSFANGDAARYFFNAGGQLKFSTTHPNTTAGINAALNTLCTNLGTGVVSGQNSGSRTIASVSYTGFTRVGGTGGTQDTYNTNAGYFGLGTANTTLLDLNSGTAPYTTTVQILCYARTNGTQGSNSDNGSIVYINVVLDKISGNGTVGSGSTCTCTVVPPATTYIANSWGTITLSGSNTVA